MVALVSAFGVLAFVVVLTNQTVQLVQVASAASPLLGKAMLYGLLALYTILLLLPVILYLSLPRQLSPPASTDSPDFPRFLEALRKRLSRNSRLRKQCLGTQQEIEAARSVS